MSGLFEDDSELRKPPAKLQAAKQVSSIGDSLINKAQGKANLAAVASSKSGVSFESVDLALLARTKKPATKNDEGKIVPTINYLADD